MGNLVDSFGVLANKERLQILNWLKEPKKNFKSEKFDVVEDGVCVGLIQEKSNLCLSTISQYLNQLQAADLILMIRQGKWTLCKLNIEGIEKFKKELNDYL
ncbi:MAG: helix-turn-helix transcriptional regulator [bacterium]|nr:helix-turn-helix transcriptional regulator [bacterium]